MASSRHPNRCLSILQNEKWWGTAACVAYCVVNLFLNVLNGWIFLRSPFRFPLSLTVLHMVIGYFITAGLFRSRAKACELFVQQTVPKNNEMTRRLAVLGLLSGLNIALNNVSLLYINVAMNQIIKAFNPVLIAICDVLVRGHNYSFNVWFGFACITLGVVCTVVNNPQFHMYGFMFCSGSAVAAGIQTTLADVIMTEDIKLDANNFMYYTSLWSAIFILPLAVVADIDVFLEQLFSNTGWFAVMILTTSILAFLNNLTLLLCIKLTSGAFSGVVGNIKIVMIVAVQQLLWPEDARELQLIHWLGIVLTVVSFGGLSMVKYRPAPKKLEDKPPEPVSPTTPPVADPELNPSKSGTLDVL